MLNPLKRSVRLPGRLGACLITGTEKIRCGYGNGDCLLLDLRHRIFAVADASERFPHASRLLLDRLATDVCRNGPPTSETEFNRLLCRIWSRQRFIHKTTLSCVVLIEGNGGPAAMVASNGDSSVSLMGATPGTMLLHTGADMNFAGRSRRPNPVETHRLANAPATIVLATDGMPAAANGALAPISGHPHRIGDRIEKQIHSDGGPGEIDDIGAIALSTQIMNEPSEAVIIMGGTRPGVETAFVRGGERKAELDRWDDVAAWKRSPELLAMAGIRVI